MTRRVAIGAVVLVAALAFVGRWEDDRAAGGQLRQIREAFDAAGGKIDSQALSAFRAGPPICLFYELGGEPFAIELCFDDEGRLVETADRRSGTPIYSTIVQTPERATVSVDPARLDALLAGLEKG